MPTKKYAQIKQQIEKLQLEAEQIRTVAIKGVIEQIRTLMEEHGISVEDIRSAITGRRRGRPPKSPTQPAKAAKKKPRGRPRVKSPRGNKKNAGSPAKTTAKYRSPADRKVSWSGRGRTPNWVKEWVESGKKLDDLLIK